MAAKNSRFLLKIKQMLNAGAAKLELRKYFALADCTDSGGHYLFCQALLKEI